MKIENYKDAEKLRERDMWNTTLQIAKGIRESRLTKQIKLTKKQLKEYLNCNDKTEYLNNLEMN